MELLASVVGLAVPGAEGGEQEERGRRGGDEEVGCQSGELEGEGQG